MKHFNWIFCLFCILCLMGCKDNEVTISQPFKTADGQDKDNDTITGDSYVYHLPVIFHVFYKNPSDTLQYIPHERFEQILSNVNELYQGDVYNHNIDTTASENIHVHFELARKDESGKTLDTP